jgi:3-phenylpropionate/trans-cinnamate dioxygenase ferredoxin reductase component
MPEVFVVVGSSLAGGTAAATLREEGFDGRVILIGEEPQAPYERPPLSKDYLRGEQPFEDALVRPRDFYASNAIDTLFGTRATRLNPVDKTIELSGSDRVRYDKVLIATGSRNRRLPIPGLDLEGVYGLRTVEDCDRIRGEIRPGRRAAVVGMGFIGSEIASSLRQLGVEVVVIEAGKVPLHRVLGEEVGRIMEHIHRDHGVDMIFEQQVSGFEGRGRVERIVTQSGRRIECDFAVVGVGVEPVVDVVMGSGIEVDNGLVVDEYCRTNAEGVFAAGDVTNHYHPIFKQRMRVEHWHNALNQGAAAARNMMGMGSVYDGIHWFWSDQYDYNLQYVGFHKDWDKLVVRGSLENRDFIAFYVKDALIAAAIGMNRGRDIRRATALIKARAAVETNQLRDDDVDLRKLVASDSLSTT